MVILGIETSCDETAASLVENGVNVLSNTVVSSSGLHSKTGGIVPEVAARKQVEAIIPVVDAAVKEGMGYKHSSLRKFRSLLENVDAFAVTTGPGLIGSLLVGVETAKAMAFSLNKPLIPVNHLIGHVYGNFVTERLSLSEAGVGPRGEDDFPAVVLLASGGHTDLLLMEAHGKFKWLGGTRDDAAGEAFDKVSRMLGLGFPGGPAIESLVLQIKKETPPLKVKLPRPMIRSHDYDMSFSGLKTAVLNTIRKEGCLSSRGLSKELVSALAYEFQEAITDVLVEKTFKAARDFSTRSVMLAGGVAANKVLREKCGKYAGKTKVRLLTPSLKFCSDNAAFVASCAYFNFNPISLEKIIADPSLSLR